VAVQTAALGAHLVSQADRAAAGVLRVGFCQLLVAEDAVQPGPDPAGPTERGERPWAVLEGRLVTDVLAVPAVEQCHPFPCVVRLEPDDGPVHGQRSVDADEETEVMKPIMSSSASDA
jgi:hypothetical protein